MEYIPKILIVDDKPENLLALESILHETEAEIIKANNGPEALKATLHHEFALVIMDVKMPEIDGYELAELIRGRNKTRHLPIIFLSAVYSDEFHVFKGYKSGAVDFITKPFKQEILLDKVMIFLELDIQKRQLQELVVELKNSNTQLKMLNERLNHEVAERKQVEEQLQRYTSELQEANEELSQYAYVVSHDLKAPLRAIHNYAEFLREDLEGSLGDDQKAYLDGLNHAVQEANMLIEDILVLSRVGRQNIGFEPVEVGTFLRSLITSLDLPDDVEVLMEDDWPTITTEPVLLRQIFQNLISNAVKFNTLSPKRIDLGWRLVEDNCYEFFVHDNGIGIDPGHQEKIFRVFERLHTKDEFEGTGIGLAIVKKAVGKLGGTVRVKSQLGEGSTFFVTLPRTTTH